jgi:hypothetical protein
MPTITATPVGKASPGYERPSRLRKFLREFGSALLRSLAVWTV